MIGFINYVVLPTFDLLSTLIFEACEYKDSFLSLRPTIGVVLNVEMDHHDYFKDVDLTQNISREETVIEAKGHVLRDTFSTSSGYHWHTCYNCAERIDEEAHDWKCYSEGGSHWQTCSVCKKTTVAMDYSYN